MTTTLDDRVKQYLELRRLKKDIETRHKEELAPLKEVMGELEGILQAHLREHKLNSANTSHGTFYQSTRWTASVKDTTAFLEYVVEHQAWDLLERRCNPTAGIDYTTRHGIPPPGVQLSSFTKVHILSPNEKPKGENDHD